MREQDRECDFLIDKVTKQLKSAWQAIQWLYWIITNHIDISTQTYNKRHSLISVQRRQYIVTHSISISISYHFVVSKCVLLSIYSFCLFVFFWSHYSLDSTNNRTDTFHRWIVLNTIIGFSFIFFPRPSSERIHWTQFNGNNSQSWIKKNRTQKKENSWMAVSMHSTVSKQADFINLPLKTK